MSHPVELSPVERVHGRSFTDLEHTAEDLAVMRHMAHQLVDIYDDPILCDFGPNKKPVCQSDPKGRHFRIYYIQPQLLFERQNLTVVGFFGQKRPTADVRPLIRADQRFEEEFENHPGLLSLSTVRLPNEDFGNLVVFTDPESKRRWGLSEIHRELVAKISPPYYKSIRLNNGTLPKGLSDPDDLRLIRVKYIEYDSAEPWRAVRALS